MARKFNFYMLGVFMLLFVSVSQVSFAVTEDVSEAKVIEDQREKDRERILKQMQFLSGSLGAMPQPPKLNKQIKLPGMDDSSDPLGEEFKMRSIFDDDLEESMSSSIFDEDIEELEKEDEIDKELEELIQGL